MKTRTAYCSARDRNVPVVIEDGRWKLRTPSHHDAEEAVRCLDYGVRCTGAFCPTFLTELPEPSRSQQ